MMQTPSILETVEGRRLKAMAADKFFGFLRLLELRMTDAEHHFESERYKILWP